MSVNLPEGGTYQLTGRTGSGKTYYAVSEILTDLLAGRPVYTNIRLKWTAVCAFARRRGVKTLPRGNYRFLEKETNFHSLLTPGASVYLDEAQLTWNARDYRETDKEQRPLLNFLTQARHVKVKVCFITQHEGNVDAQFARIAVYVVRMKNVLQLPAVAFLYRALGKPRWLRMHFAICCDRDGKTVIERDRFLASKEVYDCYDTTQLHHDVTMGGEAAAAVEGKLRRSRPGLVFMVVGALCFGLEHLMLPAPASVPPSAVQPSPQAAPVVVERRPGPVRLGDAAGPRGEAPSLEGLAGWRALTSDRWCTESESESLPRVHSLRRGVLTLVNESWAYTVGDVFRGGKITTIYQESPTTYVLRLEKPEDITKPPFYVRLYSHNGGNRVAPRSRGMDSVEPVLLGDGLPLGDARLARDGIRSVTAPPVAEWKAPAPFIPE